MKETSRRPDCGELSQAVCCFFGPRAIGGEFQKLCPVMFGFHIASELIKRAGQVVVDVGVIFVKRQGSTVGGNRQFGLTRFGQHVAQTCACLDEFRIVFDRG